MHVLEAALFTQFVERSLNAPHAEQQPEKPTAEPAPAPRVRAFAGLSRILSALSAVIGQDARSLAGGREEKAAHVLHCAGNRL